MRVALRSIVRIGVAVAAVLVLAGIASRVAITQPSAASNDRRLATRADPSRLEAHVRYLAEDVAPRSPRIPANLDAAADYVQRAFQATGGRVEEQPYEVAGQLFRNVRLHLGPANGERTSASPT